VGDRDAEAGELMNFKYQCVSSACLPAIRDEDPVSGTKVIGFSLLSSSWAFKGRNLRKLNASINTTVCGDHAIHVRDARDGGDASHAN